MRRGVVLFVAIVATSVGVGVYVYEREHEPPSDEAELATDAGGGARAASGKKKGGGKKAANKPKSTKPRGGTTRVAARAPSRGSNAYAPSVNPIAPGGGPIAAGGGGNPIADDPGGGESVPAAPRIKRGGGGPKGPTYESALAANDEKLTIGGKTAPDLSDEQLSAPMRDGSFVGDCGAPDDMGVTVKVAIRMGRAVGVSVSTSPPDSDVAGCIDRHVRSLSWPANPKTDSFVTTY